MSILQRPEGIWGAILLPVKNNKIDWVAFEEQVNILCDSRVHGIYTNGTAAECHNQTEDESLNQLLEKVLPLIKVSKS